jgi:hypothetical protein
VGVTLVTVVHAKSLLHHLLLCSEVSGSTTMPRETPKAEGSIRTRLFSAKN